MGKQTHKHKIVRFGHKIAASHVRKLFQSSSLHPHLCCTSVGKHSPRKTQEKARVKSMIAS